MCGSAKCGVPDEMRFIEWLRPAQKKSEVPIDPLQQTVYLFLPVALCLHLCVPLLSSGVQGAARASPVSVQPKLILIRHFFRQEHRDERPCRTENQSSLQPKASILNTCYEYLPFRRQARDAVWRNTAWGVFFSTIKCQFGGFPVSHESCFFARTGTYIGTTTTSVSPLSAQTSKK